MQHTEKYQFKLIDGTDDFSPTPLNDNMEKVEEQFESVETELAAINADLGSSGKNCRIAWGQYTGTGTYGQGNPTSLTFPFRPALVCFAVQNEDDFDTSWMAYPLTAAISTGNSCRMTVTWSGKTVSWYVNDQQTNPHIGQNNTYGYVYHYFAIGCDE